MLRAKPIVIAVMTLGVLLSGVAFAYKVAEFIFTISSEEAKGFADVPVVVYFAVAGGWLCLLAWSWLTGQLSGIEDNKHLPLELEEEDA